MKKELHLLTRWRKAQRVFLLLLCAAFTLPSIAQTYTISYQLRDSYGDGWNGNSIQIKIASTGTTVQTLTIQNGSSASGEVTLNYDVEYNFVWIKGSYASECSFTITGPNNDVIANYATGANFNNNYVFATYYLPTPNPFVAPTDLAVSDITTNSAKASWIGNNDAQRYNLRYHKVVTQQGFFEDVEGDVSSWTIYDGNNDDNNWSTINMTSAGLDAHSGDIVFISQSYSSNSGNYNPNDWLISPQFNLNGTLSFWVKGIAIYPDNYSVYISTTDNQITSFQPLAQNLSTPSTESSDNWSVWQKIEIDLSAYNGQQGYIAFRHHDTDGYYLLLDDISVADVSIGDWIPISPATSPQEITGLEPGTEYEVQVQAVYTDGTSDWTNSVNFITLSADAVPTNLTVTDVTDCTATANWDGAQDSYNLRYRKVALLNNISESFENGIPEGWTTIDYDGDNYGWSKQQFTPSCISSASYINNVGALNPDNWLITPRLNLGGQLSFVAWGQDADDFAEVFKVYVSTTGKAVADFVELSQDITTTHNQTTYSFDLSQYAGQEGYIAIRHYNCTNMYWLDVTDFVYNNGDNIIPEWVTINDVTSPYVIKGLDPETDYEVQVQGIYDGGTTNWTESEYFTTLEAVSRPMTLAELVANGEVGIRYTISEPLLAVYSVDNKLWLKDDNKFANPASPAEGDQNYEIEEIGNPHANQAEYDQSNWIEVQLPEGVDASIFNGHMINSEAITGVLGDKTNPVMTGVTLTEGDIDDNSTDTGYEYNYYCTANFVGPQNGTIAGETYHFFFMTPKPQECAKVVWAQYDATHNKMVMPDAGNAHGFDGAVDVDLSLNNGTAPVDGTVYNFIAVIRTTESKDGGYKVYPLNISEAVITAVNDITSKTVAGVKYYNLAGIESDRPFEGVNIIVTTYTDGTTSATKVMK